MEGGHPPYWRRVIVQAATDARNCADSIGLWPLKGIGPFVITIIIAAVSSYFLGETVSERICWALGVWLGQLGLFALILVFFVVQVPPRMERDAQTEYEKTLREISSQAEQAKQMSDDLIGKEVDKRKALQSQIDTKPATVADIREAITLLARQGRALLNKNDDFTREDWEAWFSRAKAFVKVAFRSMHVPELDRRANHQNHYDPVRGHVQRMAECVDWFNGWISNLSTLEVNPDCTEKWIREQIAAQS